jgi:hypothetical protein
MVSEAPLGKPGLEVPGDDSVERRSLGTATGVVLGLAVRRAWVRRTKGRCRWVADGDHGRFSRCRGGRSGAPMSTNESRSLDRQKSGELLRFAATGEFTSHGQKPPAQYHSRRKKKEFASPYLEFLDKLEKAARKMSQIYEFDLQHSDGIRHADLDAGVRALNELIYECQRSLEGIEHAKLDLEARGWARANGLRG